MPRLSAPKADATRDTTSHRVNGQGGAHVHGAVNVNDHVKDHVNATGQP